MADQGKILITHTVPGTSVRGNFVDGAGAFSNSNKAIGICYDDADGDTTKQVQISGTALVKAAGAFSAGASLVSDASGDAEAAGDMVDEAIKITDDDDAATTGVAVYVHSDDGVNASFKFVSPTNADGSGILDTAGSLYFIKDSDAAATDGVVMYLDEDATPATDRLLIVSPSGQDMVYTLGNGKQIKLTHSADAASDGVAVFFDEDAATADLKLMFVSPTNTDGAMTTDDSIRNLTSNAHLSRCIALEAATTAGDMVRALLI